MAFSVGFQIILSTMPVILLKEVPKGVAVGLVVAHLSSTLLMGDLNNFSVNEMQTNWSQ